MYNVDTLSRVINVPVGLWAGRRGVFVKR